MSASTDPNLGLSYGWDDGEDGWGDAMDENLKALGGLLMVSVIDRDLTTPPGGESNGDRYLVKATGAAAWAGHDGEIAVYIEGGWEFHTVEVGFIIHVADEDLLLVKNTNEYDLRPVKDIIDDVSSNIATVSSLTSQLYNILLDANWAGMSLVFGPGEDARIRLIITNDGVAAKTVTLPGGILWSGGAPWLMTAVVDAVDIIELSSPNEGAVVYGQIIGQAFA